MGYFLSSAFNSETAAVAFAPILNLPLSLLGGYMINLTSIKGKWPQQALASQPCFRLTRALSK
jgi:hypothetical protein